MEHGTPASRSRGGGGRVRDPGPDPDLWAPRWRGARGRLEVWYTTLTDPATGTGLWLHHELVAPSDGSPPYAHGLATVFPADSPPAVERFGPVPWTPSKGLIGYAAGEVTVERQRLTGTAGQLSWELTGQGGRPLHAFPRWSWRRELLPAAHVVLDAGARYTGTLRYGRTVLDLTAARGASAHLYGHGNARRWGWLHADLGGGDVLEIVAAVATRPGFRLLPPLPLVQLRVDGVDWPAGDPLLAALKFHANLSRPTWTVTGAVRDRRLRVTVELSPERTVAVDYTDPDGSTAVCHHSVQATATVHWDRRDAGGWHPGRSWTVTAHAELGERARD